LRLTKSLLNKHFRSAFTGNYSGGSFNISGLGSGGANHSSEISDSEEIDQERNGTTEEDEEDIIEEEEDGESFLSKSPSSSTEHLNLINQRHHHNHHLSHHRLLLENLGSSDDKIINNNSVSPNGNNSGGIDGLTGSSFLLEHLSRGEGSRGNLSPSISNHSGSQRKYPCGQCNRSLADLAGLEKHLRYR
jgi:hypothetical protein